MASKRGRGRRNRGVSNWVIWGGIAAVAVIALVVIFVNGRMTAASAQISLTPPAPAALDGCGGATCGDANAPVTIDVYADFQCPYCARFEPVLEQLGPDYIDTGKVKLLFHNFPFIGAESDAAAQAVMCAGDQNKYWLYANYLYREQGAENSGVYTSNNLKKMAEVVGMDSAQFNSCLDGRKYANAVQQQAAEARQRQVSSTPTFFVNGQMHAGGVTYDQLVGLVDAALAK